MRLIILAALILSGCTTSPITMQNPATGQTAQCGPYISSGLSGLATPQREAQCIADYKEQGFVRK
jgi:uncharacterized lipoprotein YajG